jgi:hypothetical protein
LGIRKRGGWSRGRLGTLWPEHCLSGYTELRYHVHRRMLLD